MNRYIIIFILATLCVGQHFMVKERTIQACYNGLIIACTYEHSVCQKELVVKMMDRCRGKKEAKG